MIGRDGFWRQNEVNGQKKAKEKTNANRAHKISIDRHAMGDSRERGEGIRSWRKTEGRNEPAMIRTLVSVKFWRRERNFLEHQETALETDSIRFPLPSLCSLIFVVQTAVFRPCARLLLTLTSFIRRDRGRRESGKAEEAEDESGPDKPKHPPSTPRAFTFTSLVVGLHLSPCR